KRFLPTNFSIEVIGLSFILKISSSESSGQRAKIALEAWSSSTHLRRLIPSTNLSPGHCLFSLTALFCAYSVIELAHSISLGDRLTISAISSSVNNSGSANSCCAIRSEEHTSELQS